MRLVFNQRVNAFLVGSLLLTFFFMAASAWADYEIYQKKGFLKVVEILEKKTNDDGTMYVKAKRADGEIVELMQVTKIVEVKKKLGMRDSGIVAPTPTPIPLPGERYSRTAGTVEHPSSPPPGRRSGRVDIDGVAENYRPNLYSLLDNIKWVALAIAGVAVLVIFFFIFSKTSG